MKLVELNPSDVKLTIDEFAEKQHEFECVLLVAINKDGTQFSINSSMSIYQKSFLCQFIQSSIFWWFRDLETK